MKRIFTLLAFFYISILSYGQLELAKHDGTIINDGDVLVFNSITEAEAKLKIHVKNTSSTNDIYVKAEVLEIVNTDGTNFTFSLQPTCVFQIQEGDTYPDSSPAYITAGSDNDDFDYLWNEDAGNGTDIIDYKFKFYVSDASGFPTGNSITFTYRYDPNAVSTKAADLSMMGIDVLNTITRDHISLKLNNQTFIKVYDITGKVVKTEVLSAGNRQINVSNYNSGVYLLEFSNDNGRKATIKIVKQ